MLRSVVDPRVRYLGLSHNHGEQSAPNNAGVAAATGDFIAFLNHDDLWFPDHLEVLLDAATESAADLAHSLSARIDPEGRTHLWGDSPGGEYAPWHVVPASTWLFTRGLATRIGPWTSAADVYDAPSQDWLRRAHAGGGRFAVVVRLTAVQITSGGGQRSYADREEAPHAAMRQAMAEPARCRERLLTDIALGSSPMATSVHPVALAMRTLKAGAARVAIAAGVPPVVLFSMVRYGRRGDLSGAGGAPAGCHLRLEHAHDGSLVVARRVEGRAVHDRGLDVDHAPGHDGVHVREVRHVIGASGYLTEIYRADWGLDTAQVDQVFELTLSHGAVSAWHAHGDTRDRLFVTDGTARVVLYDSRPESPTRGVVSEFKAGALRPMLIVVPPRVGHGVQALGTVPARVIKRRR